MSNDLKFSPGFQTHHFKTTNVPGTLVTVVPLESMPQEDDAINAWIQDFLDLVSKEHGGSYELGNTYKAGSYGGTSVVINVKKVSDG